MVKKSKFILGVAIFVIFSSIIPVIALARPIEPPPPPPPTSVKPTSYHTRSGYGHHTSGVLSDVYTNNGVSLGFRQDWFVLEFYFEFPNIELDYLLFDFTDTATWPYTNVVSVYVKETDGDSWTAASYLGDGFHNIDLSGYDAIDRIYISLDVCWFQYLYIDLCVAYQ